jgi:hypothetical protein
MHIHVQVLRRAFEAGRSLAEDGIQLPARDCRQLDLFMTSSAPPVANAHASH